MMPLPVIRSRDVAGDTARFGLGVAADGPWFDGHFPGWPILPGAVQLGWAVALARECFGFAGPPTDIRRLKFRHPIAPGDRLMLELTRGGDRVGFVLRKGKVTCSSGSLVFAAALAP